MALCTATWIFFILKVPNLYPTIWTTSQPIVQSKHARCTKFAIYTDTTRSIHGKRNTIKMDTAKDICLVRI